MLSGFWQMRLSRCRGATWRKQWHPTPVLLPGKSHGRRSLVCCSPWGRKESDTTERLHFHFSLPCIGEGNGNPLQCSCLENPRDRGAWWAAVYGVAQSQTQLSSREEPQKGRIWTGLWNRTDLSEQSEWREQNKEAWRQKCGETTPLKRARSNGCWMEQEASQSGCIGSSMSPLMGETPLHTPGEGNGNPLWYSCLENPVDRGAWQAESIGLQRVGHNWAHTHAPLHSPYNSQGLIIN